MKNTKETRYAQSGASAQKEEVHKAVAQLKDRSLYKDTFCKVMPDVLNGEMPKEVLKHALRSSKKSKAL